MGKKIVALFAGVVAAIFVIMVVKLIGQELVVAQRNGALTTAIWLITALAWFFGALAGTFLAQRIDHARRPVPALLVGLTLLALAIYDMSVGAPPVWFRVLGVFVFLPGTIFGILLAKRRAVRRRTPRHA